MAVINDGETEGIEVRTRGNTGSYFFASKTHHVMKEYYMGGNLT